MDGDDVWTDLEAAVMSRLADPALAARLTDLFLLLVVDGMEPDERPAVLSLDPPRFGQGSTPAGRRILDIRFGGRRLVWDWNGSPEDAEGIIADGAETFRLYGQIGMLRSREQMEGLEDQLPPH